MDNLPDVVKRKIFGLLSQRRLGQRSDWRTGAFYPIGQKFNKNEMKQSTDCDRLKFCLIYPDYVYKLNIDLNKVINYYLIFLNN